MRVDGDANVFPNGPDAPPGLTIRQWFAGMAMQAILSTYVGDVQLPSEVDVAMWSIEYAYAIISEMEEE